MSQIIPHNPLAARLAPHKQAIVEFVGLDHSGLMRIVAFGKKLQAMVGTPSYMVMLDHTVQDGLFQWLGQRVNNTRILDLAEKLDVRTRGVITSEGFDISVYSMWQAGKKYNGKPWYDAANILQLSAVWTPKEEAFDPENPSAALIITRANVFGRDIETLSSAMLPALLEAPR